MIVKLRTLVLLSLTGVMLAGCNNGLRDSLVLTGLRSKPDELLVQRNAGLVVPPSQTLMLPGQLSEGSITRGHEYQVNKILYGKPAADQRAYVKLQQYQPGALPPTERQLLQIAGADARGVVTPRNVERDGRGWRFGDPLFGPRGIWFRGDNN